MNIYDIAKKAGVAASTVSRVVNDKPGIKAETREKIRRLLKKYNYEPNQTARGLVNRTSHTIGILMPDIRVLNHTACAYTVQREMAANGYCCFIVNTGEDFDEIAVQMRLLRQRQIDGLIVIGSFYQCPEMEEKVREFFPAIPVVMANATLDLPNVHSVMLDEITGVSEMVDSLWRKGKRNFAFVIPEKREASVGRKLKGFKHGIAVHGRRRDLWIYHCENSPRGGYDVAVEIVKRHPKVDAIMFCWDLEATGALRALVDMGIDIPGQVAVTGVDNSLYCELSYPKLSSVDVKPRDMSYAAARIMLDLLAGVETVRVLVIPPRLCEREST